MISGFRDSANRVGSGPECSAERVGSGPERTASISLVSIAVESGDTDESGLG